MGKLNIQSHIYCRTANWETSLNWSNPLWYRQNLPLPKHNKARTRALQISLRLNSSPTRSTPRAQTSAAPSLKSVKQSAQAWNSVAYCFLCPYPENFMSVHPCGIPWCCQQTWIQKIEKETLCPRGLTDHPQNITDCPLWHSQHGLTISWKYTHQFYWSVANKHVRGA